ncbi:hypothetical protein ACPPVO_26455 [Dactylosporangium sp. McL0621]|uniref:hypothetical protein n=1 Tax=Dactylosporangium sp. McL0621 TaxID=3415678 RepID=UPI003CF3335B
MTSLPLQRTEYINLSLGGPRGGATAHAESLVDAESYLVPHDRMLGADLFTFGVADGLAVTATTGQTTLQIGTGVALDGNGNLIALAANGWAVTDPSVDPTQVVNIPIVPVVDTGVPLATTPATGECYLTITFREVLDPAATPTQQNLFHAPWLRLIPVADLGANGDQVVLARVSLDGQSQITAVTAENRRPTGLPAGRVELRRARVATGGQTAVGQVPAADITAAGDGSLSVTMRPDGGAAHQLLKADTTGNTLALQPGGGSVGVGLQGQPPQRTVHVEGNEVHSGGNHGGFSFADRTVGSFDETGGIGGRWIWYAQDGVARLWSGSDQVTVATRSSAPNAGAGPRVGIGAPTATHALHVGVTSGIRQNAQYLSGTLGWSSLSYNAFHNDANSAWVFPVPTRPAVTLEMDDVAGVGRFQVFSTTKAAPQSFVLRFAVDGETGDVLVPGKLTSGSLVTGAVTSAALTSTTAAKVTAFNVTAADSHAICATNNSTTSTITAVNDINGGLGSAISTIGDVNVLGFGSFSRDVDVTGTLSAGAKRFTIDHPLDPANRLLNHTSVESDERAVQYNGNVTLAKDGTATVRLPEWMDALATDFRYQLTCIGGHANVYIAEEVRDNAFRIAGGTAGLKVSWQLTGVRQDAFARANDFVVEEDKPEDERGFYVHPEAYGRQMDASVHWPRNAELIKRNPALAKRSVRTFAAAEAGRVETQNARRQTEADRAAAAAPDGPAS